MPEPIRRTKLDVKPGLYVLRYVGSIDPRTAPSATVEAASGSADRVTIVSIPGRGPGEIAAPGGGVVIVASAAGAIEIRIEALKGSHNFDAKFSLDLIGLGEEVSHPENQHRDHASDGGVQGRSAGGRSGQVPLDLLAHVSLRGDIKADADGWLAGPKLPSSIEGIQVATRRDDVSVTAQFRNAMTGNAWSPWMRPNSWVGTRQQACPLTGLRLKIDGTEADRFELEGEALFLGAPRMSGRGREIEFVAPGDLDPLVGLNLKLFERYTSQKPAVVEKTSRVRVFR